jgi:hypothetical protein
LSLIRELSVISTCGFFCYGTFVMGNQIEELHNLKRISQKKLIEKIDQEIIQEKQKHEMFQAYVGTNWYIKNNLLKCKK